MLKILGTSTPPEGLSVAAANIPRVLSSENSSTGRLGNGSATGWSVTSQRIQRSVKAKPCRI